MTIKKIAAVIMTLALTLTLAAGAVADEATALPFGVSFSMDYDTAHKTLGEGAEADDWGEETGMLMLGECEVGIGALKALDVSFQIDRNNSDNASRLSQISISLSVDGGAIAAFRAALGDMTAAYGAPDEDPFNEMGVENYVEYGNLSATWTKADTRINLYMSRMYYESLVLDFTNRICYNADDLK